MIYNIQISRGIAALLVLVSHANLMVNPALFDGVFLIGWSGLHFFFVLSGFIIYQAHSHQIADRISFAPYLYKRVRRIYPIYWVYTLIVLAISLLATVFFSRHLITWTRVDAGTVMQSLTLWPTDMSSGQMPIIPVAWTLSYEMLFYGIFGIALIVRPWLSILVVAIWALLIVASIAGLFKATTPLLIVAANPMNLEFMLGCLAGFLVKRSGRSWTRRTNRLVLISGLILLALAWYNAHLNYTLFGKFEALQFGMPFFLIVLSLALLDQGGTRMPGRLKRVAIYVGDASYSIYLTHFILIVGLVPFFRAPGSEGSVSDFLLIVVISGIVGCIGYSTIERPLLNLLPRKYPFTPVGTWRTRAARPASGSI